MSGWKARAEANQRFLIEQAQAHGDDLAVKRMETYRPLHFLGLTGTIGWSSKDLLLTYSAEFPQNKPAKKTKRSNKGVVQSSGLEVVKVTKQTCEQTVN